jgi:hypothetical protein
VGKEDTISSLKYIFPCKFHGIKIVTTAEGEIRSIILSLESKNSSAYDKITSRTLRACA